MPSENIYDYVKTVVARYDNYQLTPTRLYIKKITSPDNARCVYYFGKYTKLDILKYTGSGVKWKNYIKKWGVDRIETLWISDWYTDAKEILTVALSFSMENDIVDSNMWANLICDSGLSSHPKRPLDDIQCAYCQKMFQAEWSRHRICCSVVCAAKYREPRQPSTTTYRFKQISTQTEFIYTIAEFKSVSGLSSQAVYNLTAGLKKTAGGDWTIWDESIQMFRNEIPKSPPYVRQKYACCHCKGMFDLTNLGRWHNDNCKLKNSATL